MVEGSTAVCPVCLKGTTRPLCRAVLYPGNERDIRECADCGSAFYFPTPSTDEIARCYRGGYFSGFFRQYWKDYYKGRALALRLSAWRPEGELLDVGCALGTLLAGVRDGSRWRVRGLELSSEAADMGGRLNKVEITVSALSSAPLAAGRFDCVHVNNVLEHAADPVAALKKVSVLLNDRGRMELTVPNGPVDLLPNVTLFRRLGRPVKTRHGGHLFFFTRAGLEAMLSAAGLRAVSFRNFHFKQGMKARGWLPGAYRSFLRSAGDCRGESKVKETLETYKGLIPPAASWPLYYARYRLRRMFYCPFSDFGADFSVVAEKK